RRVLVFAEFILVIFFYSFSIISLVPQLLSPFFFSFFIVPRPPIPSLFPYTTLFRSVGRAGAQGRWRRGGRFRPPGRGRRHREAGRRLCFRGNEAGRPGVSHFPALRGAGMKRAAEQSAACLVCPARNEAAGAHRRRSTSSERARGGGPGREHQKS